MLIVGVLLWSAGGGALAGGLLARWALRGGAAKQQAALPTDRPARPRTGAAAGDERPRTAMVRVAPIAPERGGDRDPVGVASADAGTRSPAAPAAPFNPADAQFPRYFGASLAALGLAVTGRLIAPPLGWLALPPLLKYTNGNKNWEGWANMETIGNPIEPYRYKMQIFVQEMISFVIVEIISSYSKLIQRQEK